MQAINVEAEFRKANHADTFRSAEEYADSMRRIGTWIEDDGDYYTSEEWDSQYDMEVPDPEEPDTDCHCNHPECGAC